MSENSYKKMLSFIRERKILEKSVVTLCRAITLAIYISYPIFLIYLFLISYNNLLKIILIPLISLIVLSIIRKLINKPRPYEIYDIEPLYKKGTKGKSCPSRHTFSAFIIAFCTMYVSLPIGIIVIALAFLLATTRVLCGIHFIRDVVWGFISAVLSAIFLLI